VTIHWLWQSAILVLKKGLSVGKSLGLENLKDTITSEQFRRVKKEK
jgi:hypothetical protein